MSKKNDNVYEPPKMEVWAILPEQAVLQMSGYGSDTYDDFEFGERS